MSRNEEHGPLIGAIDEGTSSTRFLVFSAKTSQVLTCHQIDLPHICPQEGWVEMDPILILNAVIESIGVACSNLEQMNMNYNEIMAIGISNQRETTVLWDSNTGKPLFNALVWLDVRTASTVDMILQDGKRSKNFVKSLCGLPVSTYFSALKIRWLIDHVPAVREAIANGTCLFGTIDTWLIWNLTGGTRGGVHVTDVTNASRTMLMNIETLRWDQHLCDIFGIPMQLLPEIRSSSEIYGHLCTTELKGLPISGCLGDQQAALVGQLCLSQGQAKCTYGTGCFLLYNTGSAPVQSAHGLLTTVAYQLGKDQPVGYALEGSIAIAGVAMRWLRDNLGVLENVSDSARIACEANTLSGGEVVFVPAFSGLYAPYWRKDARSVICGLSSETRSAHVVKAALEAVAFQVRDILTAMRMDCSGVGGGEITDRAPLTRLLVDGGMTSNELLMQMQADYTGISIVRPQMCETSALGAAIAAGAAHGVQVWDVGSVQCAANDVFVPRIGGDERDIKYNRWKKGIARCLDWAETNSEEETGLPSLSRLEDMPGKDEQCRINSLPCSLFFFGSMAMLVLAKCLHYSKIK